MSICHPKIFNQCGVRYLALLIKDNAVPIDECFCQFASIEAITEGLETIKISQESFLEVAAYLLGEFLDAQGRLRLFQVMDVDQDGFLGIHDWRESMTSAEYWMSEEGKHVSAAIRIQSVWRGHFERCALIVPVSGLFTLEAVIEPIENQKYWDDEDEEIFFDIIPATVIDDSLSPHDVLSALTSLAQSKGLTPHSLFVYICKSSTFEPEKSFILDEFVESFLNLCGENVTSQLHDALSQAFNQLLDLNGDLRVSSTEFFWVMRQYFESQHAATWIDDDSTHSIKNVHAKPLGAQEPDMKANISKPVLISNDEAPSTPISVLSNEDKRATAKLKSFETFATSQDGGTVSSQRISFPVSSQNMASVASTMAVDHLASNAAFQLEAAAAKAAELKKSSEAAASAQLAEAAAIKLAAEKLFAEATELKRATEAAAAKQIAETSAIQQAAEIAAAQRITERSSAVPSTDAHDLKKASIQFAPEQVAKENSISVKSFKSGLGHELNSTAPTSKHNEASINTSVVPASKAPPASKHLAFDPRSLAHDYDPSTGDLNIMDLSPSLVTHQVPRPASSGDPQAPKSVRFAANRPSTSDGSRPLGSDVSFSSASYASQTHQSRQPNSQQQVIMKTQEEAFPASRRPQERPSTSYTSSTDNGLAFMSSKQNSPIKVTISEVTKRVLFVDAENACTWIRACAQKIGSR